MSEYEICGNLQTLYGTSRTLSFVEFLEELNGRVDQASFHNRVTVGWGCIVLEGLWWVQKGIFPVILPKFCDDCLWPPSGIGQTIIFLPCGFFYLLSSIYLFFLA